MSNHDHDSIPECPLHDCEFEFEDYTSVLPAGVLDPQCAIDAPVYACPIKGCEIAREVLV